MKPTRTWILIADGSRARVLENDGPGHGLRVVDGMTFDGDHASTHEIVSDRAGRSHSSVGPGWSAIEAHSDPHRNLKKKFAHQLADYWPAGSSRNPTTGSSLSPRRRPSVTCGRRCRLPFAPKLATRSQRI
jgi:hypothetical protein